MRSSWLLPTTAASITLAGFFGWQWYRATDEAATLRLALAEAQARLAMKPPPPRSLPPKNAESALRPPPVVSPPTALKPAGDVTPNLRSQPLLGGPQREIRLRQMVLGTLESWPDFADELGLTKAEARELLYMMIEHSMRPEAMISRQEMQAMRSDPEARRQLEERGRAAKVEAEAAVAARFGQAVVDKYKTYEQSLGARYQVREFQTALIDSDFPLTSAQRQQLTTAFTRVDSEAQVRNQTRLQLARDSGDDAARRALYKEMSRDREVLLDAEAAAVLTSAQRSVWDQWRADKRDQNALELQWFREQQAAQTSAKAGAQGSTQPPPR
jgi:hypothetical protein